MAHIHAGILTVGMVKIL